MLLGNSGDSLKNAGVIDINNPKSVYSGHTTGSDSGNMFRFRLKQRSSLELNIKSLQGDVNAELIRDENRNNRLDRNEVVASAKTRDQASNALKANNLQGTYFVRLSSTTEQPSSFQFSLSTKQANKLNTTKQSWAATQDGRDGYQRIIDRPTSSDGDSNSNSGNRPTQTTFKPTTGSIGPKRWKGQFINQTESTVANYNTFNFDQPAAIVDLGTRGSSGKTAASLQLDFGSGSPVEGVQSNNFAMQATTRVKLKEGRFYRISSDSDDGTRFLFKDPKTGKVVAEAGGDWRDRTIRGSTWSQVIQVPQGGRYQFVVQYYDKAGDAVVDVDLEEVQPTGKVVSSSGVNIRKQPSTAGNSPTSGLKRGDTFKIVRQVASNDTQYPQWYEIETNKGERGYIAANDRLVEVSGGGRVIAIGGLDGVTNNNNNPPPSPPSGGGSSASGTAYIRGGEVALRTSSSTTSSIISDLGINTAVSITDKVTGSSYGTDGIYNQWYKVKVNVNGKSQEGYVAAFYVAPSKADSFYPTALSRESNYYREHLNEANNPYYSSGSSYKSIVDKVVSQSGSSWLKSSLVGAIGSRESGWGLLLSPTGPKGTGDYGYGRGLLQIDSEAHPDFISKGTWQDPESNIRYGVENVLISNYNYLDRNTNLEGMDLLRGAIASYNAGAGNVIAAIEDGLDVDAYTTGKDYSWDVINRAGWFQQNGWA